MDSQLQQLIQVQSDQILVLKNQLRWLKASLLTLLVLVAVAVGCLGVLNRDRQNANVVSIEPILDPLMSIAENDTTQFQLPAIGQGKETSPIQSTTNGLRIEVPPMSSAPVALDFSFPVSAVDRPGRGCDGMCL